MSNLLVVDFDYFFSNPLDGGEFRTPEVMLYDWGHIESQFNIEDIWPSRAASFIRHGLELPGVAGWERFWDRFQFEEETELLYADSNVHAGEMRPYEDDGPTFESVWLFDAHHDAGYRARSAEEFVERGVYTCEDWMLVHHLRGSELHVRYPAWKTEWRSAEPEPAVALDRAMDDGQPLNVVFDQVYLCRSGAWVPPWCDADFMSFLAEFPGGSSDIEEHLEIPRAFDIEDARQQAEVFRLMEERLRSGRTGV